MSNPTYNLLHGYDLVVVWRPSCMVNALQYVFDPHGGYSHDCDFAVDANELPLHMARTTVLYRTETDSALATALWTPP